MSRDSSFKSLQWGYGAGLLECQRCRALVLPDGADDHFAICQPEANE